MDEESENADRIVNSKSEGEVDCLNLCSVDTGYKDLSGASSISLGLPDNGSSGVRLDIISPITNDAKELGEISFEGYELTRMKGNVEKLSLEKLDSVSSTSSKLKYPIQKHNKKKSALTRFYLMWHQVWKKIFLGLMIVIFLTALGGFISLSILFFKGNRGIFENYFKSLDAQQRNELIHYLKTKFGVTDNRNMDTSPSIDSAWYNNVYRKRLNNLDVPRGSWLAGENSIEGISDKYRQDLELTAVMSVPNISGTLFYGVAYAPRGAIEPKCGSRQRQVLLDIATLSRVTTRIRNYGMQCQQSEMILDAIQALNLNMTLAMGVWIGNNEEINRRQMQSMKDVLIKYPRGLFECIFIGNEVLFREDLSSFALSEYIKEARHFLNEIGYSDLPVGTSEIGSRIDKNLMRNCDIIGANVHPFFSGGNVYGASKWVYEFIKYQLEPIKNNRTEIVITEVGWPYAGGKYQSAVADKYAFQHFLKDWVCDAYERDYGWYYFEAFDEPWKRIFYEGENKWETEWGIFTTERKQKEGVDFPRC